MNGDSVQQDGGTVRLSSAYRRLASHGPEDVRSVMLISERDEASRASVMEIFPAPDAEAACEQTGICRNGDIAGKTHVHAALRGTYRAHTDPDDAEEFPCLPCTP